MRKKVTIEKEGPVCRVIVDRVFYYSFIIIIFFFFFFIFFFFFFFLVFLVYLNMAGLMAV